jgi:hypothetical protein
MRTVTFASIMNAVAYRAGLDPTDNTAWTPAIQAEVAEFILTRTKKCWEFDFWPEWTVLEARAYRNAYDPSVNYLASTDTTPTEVWFPAAMMYAQCLQPNGPGTAVQAPFVQVAGVWVANSPFWELSLTSYNGAPWAPDTAYTGGAPGAIGGIVLSPLDDNFYECIVTHVSGANFDPTKFALLTPFEKYVSLDQVGQTPIGEVQQISRSNPRTNPRFPGPLTFVINNHGILPAPLAGPRIWVSFRLRPPVFTTTAYAGGTTYGLNAVIFDGTDCYLSLAGANTGNTPSTSPTWWAIQAIPYVIAEAIKLGAYSDLLRASGQNEKADDEEEKSDAKLGEAVDVVFASEAQYDRAQAQVY